MIVTGPAQSNPAGSKIIHLELCPRTSLSLPQTSAPAAGFAFFFAAWALYGSLIAADRSLHHDLLEAYAWGKEFQLGYNQHPPFWAWLAGLWFLVLPNTNTSFILLSVLNTTIGLAGAWRLIGLFAHGRERNTATLLLLATPFYTFLSYKYNANIIFISLWPWTLYFFVKSLDNMRLGDSVIFSLLAAASMLSKYFAITLLLTCAVSLIFHPNARRYIASPLPYVAAGIFLLLVLPHVIWLVDGSAPPVAYAMYLTGRGWLFSLQNCVRFLAGAGLYHCIVAAIVLFSRHGSRARAEAAHKSLLVTPRDRFLAALVLGPPIFTVIFGLSFQLKISPNMAVGCFPLMPLFLMRLAGPLDLARCYRYSAWTAIAVTIAALLAVPFITAILVQRSNDPVLLEPRKELAAEVTALWRAETGLPLRFVGAATRYANAISFYSSDRPSSLIDLSYAKAPWVKPEKLAAHGLVIACEHEDIFCLAKARKFLAGGWKQRSIEIASSMRGAQAREYSFDVFIVPPREKLKSPRKQPSAAASLPHHGSVFSLP
jgi:hypothetical protein